MKYPAFLKEKGNIGFIAPSFGCNSEPYYTAFLNACKKFKSMGYILDIGPNCFKGEGIGISNKPDKCAEEFMNYYQSENDILISCGGGELMCEILPYIQFEELKTCKPKWFMGFSDNTNMTFLLTTICDVASIYAPCAASFGMEPWHEAIYDTFDLIHGKKLTMKGYELWEREGLKDEEHPLLPYNCTEPKIIKSNVGNVNFEGRLIGGCLDCLINLAGTKFDYVSEFVEKYKDDGIIWYLEACDLNVMGIERALWQLKESGWFQHVKGFMIGRPLCFGEEMFGITHYDAILRILNSFNVPVLMDVDLGHLPPMIPLINGSIANVSFNNNDLTIDMKLK